MSTVSRSNEGELGIALQSAEGSAAANPQYAGPVYSGIPKPTQDTKEIEVSSTSAQVLGLYKTNVHWEMDSTFPAQPAGLGMWLKALLPSLSTSGTTNYTHTFTIGTSAPSFVTLFSEVPGGAYRKFADGTVSDLALQFEPGEMVKVNAKAMGYTPSDLASAYSKSTPNTTVTESMATAGPWFTFVGATVTFDEDSQTPVAHTEVQSGTLTLSRTVGLEQTNAITPSHRNVSWFRTGCSLDVIWQDYQAFKATYYGAVAGTTPSALVVQGIVDITFAVGPTANANQTLEVQLKNVALLVNDPPDPNPNGDTLKMTLVGTSSAPTSGELVTVTLKNQQASYPASS